MLNQREVKAFIETTRAASAARYRRRQGFLDLLTQAFDAALTRPRIVRYRRYRGVAASEVARREGIRFGSSQGILNIPVYEDYTPPGLGRALAFQLI